MKLQTLHELETICHNSNQQVRASCIPVVSGCLEDGDHDVKEVALEVLAAITEKGDKEVIAAVSARLDDGKLDVRRGAVEALATDVECAHDPARHSSSMAKGFLQFGRNPSPRISSRGRCRRQGRFRH